MYSLNALWIKASAKCRNVNVIIYIYIYIYIYISSVKIGALTQEINFCQINMLKIFKAINAGAGLRLATPFTTAAPVSFFLRLRLFAFI